MAMRFWDRLPYYTSNEALTAREMETNARCVYYLLRENSPQWSVRAIAALLGNAEAESTINPGRWAGGDDSDPNNAYGLVQWNPSTKFTDWCADNLLDPAAMPSATARLYYELRNGLQWIQTAEYPITFDEFIRNYTRTPEWLAAAFMRNYERPGSGPSTAREALARKWYDYIRGLAKRPRMGVLEAAIGRRKQQAATLAARMMRR